MKDDTISMAAALDALNGCTEIYLNNLPPTIFKTDAVEAVTALPSAQPDHIGEVTEMVGDTILRAKAIDAVRKAKDKSEAHRMLIQMPSAQLAQDLSKGCTDIISRQAALNAICEDGTQLERQGQYSMTMAERKQRDVDILEALPSAQPDIDVKFLIRTITTGIMATDTQDVYSCGMRNGMRWCRSLIDGKEPLYENCPYAQPEII